MLPMIRHARACPGHPRLGDRQRKTWMAGGRRAEATPSFGRLRPAMTENQAAPLPTPFPREHLFQDLPLDALVGEGCVMPPPAVALHLLGCRDEAIGDRGKVVIRKVQAEDQPA